MVNIKNISVILIALKDSCVSSGDKVTRYRGMYNVRGSKTQKYSSTEDGEEATEVHGSVLCTPGTFSHCTLCCTHSGIFSFEYML